jgi:hypothetical protein
MSRDRSSFVGRCSAIGRSRAHVFRVERKRGPAWYAKYRLPDGRQVQKRIGPAWTARGRPAAGYFTKRTAEDWLRAVLDQARCRAYGDRIVLLLGGYDKGADPSAKRQHQEIATARKRLAHFKRRSKS